MNKPDSENTCTTQPLSLKERIAYFPVNGFASVMGMSGLSIAWQKIAPSNSATVFIGYLLGCITTALFVFLLVSYIRKLRAYPERVKNEFNHAQLLNFFPAISISFLLVSVIWQSALPSIAIVIWFAGTLLQLVLTLSVVNQWLFRDGFSLEQINPAWYIPAVANIIVPLSGAYFGFIETSWFFFSIGIFFWIILSTLIFKRLFFRSAKLPAPLTPTLFIFLAPPSIGLIAYTGMTGSFDNIARFFYYIALFTGLLLLTNYYRFTQLPFYLSSWAFSFPSAALTIATIKTATMTDKAFFWWLSCILLVLLTALLGWLATKTIKAYINQKICVPE